MPKVVLPFARNRAVVPLPAVCMRCGKPATRTIPMQFSGRVVKIMGMRFYRPGPKESVVVQTPLCDGHPFMGQAKWMMLVGFLILLPFIGLGALTKPWIHHYVIVFPLIALIIAGTAFVFYVFLSSAVTPEPMSPRSLPGLVGYWPFDDGRGTAAQDQSGHGILAIIHGGDWAPGIKGTAVRLDGKQAFVDLGPEHRLSFRAGEPFTIAGWIATQADAGVVSSFRRRDKAFPVIDVFVKDGNLRGWVRDDTSGFGGAKVVGGPVKDGKWHHVALVRQPDGTIELFLDAVFQARDKGKSSGGPITTDLHALGSERFAGQSKKAAPAYFAGSLDEFCVYNRALPAEEVAVLSGKKQ